MNSQHEDFDPSEFDLIMGELSNRLDLIKDLAETVQIKDNLQQFKLEALRKQSYTNECFYGFVRSSLESLIAHIERDDVARFCMFFRQLDPCVSDHAYGEWRDKLHERFIRFAGKYPFELTGKFEQCDDHFRHSYFYWKFRDLWENNGWKSLISYYDGCDFLKSEEGFCICQSALIQTLKVQPHLSSDAVVAMKNKFARFDSVIRQLDKQSA